MVVSTRFRQPGLPAGLGWSVVVCLLVAGCAGAGSPESTATPTAAASPTVTAETGAIEGSVTDDEGLPVSGAVVAIVETGEEKRTDEAGGFSFSELRPGATTVVVNRVGFEQAAKRVDVLAGQVARLDFVLKPIAVVVPYADPYVFDGYIRAGQALLDIVTSGFNLPGCEQCRWYFNITAGVKTIVTEIEFTPTITDPRGNQLYFALYNMDTELYQNAYWTSRSTVVIDSGWPEEGEPLYQLNACDIDFVCAEQRFTGYITVFYHEKAPSGFSALPPE